MSEKEKIFCAVDVSSLSDAERLLEIIKDEIGGIKLGLEFFISQGLEGVKKMKKYKLPIFLDLKLHDIPNTVNKAFLSALQVEPEYLSVHISGGKNMLNSISKIKSKTKIVGITMLTSLASEDLNSFGLNISSKEYVNNLTKLAVESNLDGLVCSPQEIKEVKKISMDNLIIITPGIRLESKENQTHDQKRFLSPGQAIKNGSNILIIGRTVTDSAQPLETLKKIKHEIKEYSKS